MSFAYYIVREKDEVAIEIAKKLKKATPNATIKFTEDEWDAFTRGLGDGRPRIITATKKVDGEED